MRAAGEGIDVVLEDTVVTNARILGQKLEYGFGAALSVLSRDPATLDTNRKAAELETDPGDAGRGDAGAIGDDFGRADATVPDVVEAPALNVIEKGVILLAE